LLTSPLSLWNIVTEPDKATLEENAFEFDYQPKLFGKPDFLIKPNIVVFCDSSFWHGRNWKKLKPQLKEGYWQEHILGNIRRDRIVNSTLKKENYIILRFWDKEITKFPNKVIKKIRAAQAS
jgi:DNA mismatch endonuclease, patch repair protein